MKNFMKIGVIAMLAAFTMISCNKKEEKNLPADAPAIQGETEGVGSVELSIAAIDLATSYKWYKDGAAVQESEALTYTATESGVYKVAGVNKDGEGKASPDHTVTITEAPTGPSVDDLVGKWTVTGFYAASGTAYLADHSATFTKVDDTTVKISGFIGTDEWASDTPGNRDEFLFNFNRANQTLTILNHEETEIDWNPNYFCFIAPPIENTYCDNVGLDFPAFKVEENNGAFSIDMILDTGEPYTIDGEPYYGTCHLIAGETSAADCLGGFGTCIGYFFTKGATKASAPVNRTIVSRSYEPSYKTASRALELAK